MSWAVQFPAEIKETDFPWSETIANRARDFVEGNPPEADAIIEAARHHEGLRDILAEYLTPRYPSQIYQALMEGLALFLILLVVRLKFRYLPNGIITGLFFILYAFFRIIGEQFRQPESGYGPLGLTKGQFLSTFMIAIGAAFLIGAAAASKRKRIVSP